MQPDRRDLIDPDLLPEAVLSPADQDRARRMLEHAYDLRAAAEGQQAAARMRRRSGERLYARGLALTLSGIALWGLWFLALYALLSARLYTGVPQ